MSDQPPPSRRHLPWRALLAWAGILLAGLVLLIGRYDWSGPERFYARRGWALSAYLFVLSLPLLYHLVKVLAGRRAAAAATGVAFVVLTVPYRWLGLDAWYHDRGRDTQWYRLPIEHPWLDNDLLGSVDPVPVPRERFLPDGPWSTFPRDVALFAGLALLAVVVAVVARRRAPGRTPGGRRRIAAALAVFLVLVVQTFLHSGVRAPYVYTPHYNQAESAEFWYAVAMFDNGEGVVNADQFVFSAIEDYFQGAARDTNNMLIRRPLGFYASSQFSYFVNTYYVWIVVNLATWFAAVLAGFGFARRLAGERVGLLVAAMIACGTGFVAFVGTPAMYLQHYAVVIVALYLLERLLVDERGPGRFERFALFGAAVGACALVYDAGPLLPVLLLYGLARRVTFWPLAASLAGGYLAYRGFLFVHNDVLGIPVVPTNAEQADVARQAVADLLRHPSVTTWAAAATDIVTAFAAMLIRVFFVLPVVPALVGIRFLRGRAQAVLVVSLLAMSLASIAVLRIGGLHIGTLPRFVYPSYPAVYLLAALALAALAERRGPPRLRAAFRAAPWCFVALLLVASNIDAWGYPSMYSEALEGGPPVVTP